MVVINPRAVREVEVADEFDRDGDLRVEMQTTDGRDGGMVWLSEVEVLRLHSHLAQVLRARGHNV